MRTRRAHGDPWKSYKISGSAIVRPLVDTVHHPLLRVALKIKETFLAVVRENLTCPSATFFPRESTTNRSMDSDDDANLVARVLAGDKPAFGDLIDRRRAGAI